MTADEILLHIFPGSNFPAADPAAGSHKVAFS